MSDNIFLNKIWNPEKGEFEPLSQDVLSKYINNFMEGRDNIQTGGGGKKGGKGQGEKEVQKKQVQQHQKDKEEEQVQQHQKDKDKE